MSYAVAVPRSLPPKFPDRCVLCGADNPGKQARFHAGANYGAFFFMAWFETGRKSIMAPACGSCAVSAMSRGLLRFAVSAGCAILAGWYLFWVMGMKGGRGLGKLKAVAVFFAAVVPAVIWDWLFPAKFSVTFDDENHQAVCHFSDPGYAAQFDALNHPEFAESLELPASFNPSASSNSAHPPADYSAAESFEDKTNPFRNLEDPRFRKK